MLIQLNLFQNLWTDLPVHLGLCDDEGKGGEGGEGRGRGGVRGGEGEGKEKEEGDIHTHTPVRGTATVNSALCTRLLMAGSMSTKQFVSGMRYLGVTTISLLALMAASLRRF